MAWPASWEDWASPTARFIQSGLKCCKLRDHFIYRDSIVKYYELRTIANRLSLGGLVLPFCSRADGVFYGLSQHGKIVIQSSPGSNGRWGVRHSPRTTELGSYYLIQSCAIHRKHFVGSYPFFRAIQSAYWKPHKQGEMINEYLCVLNRLRLSWIFEHSIKTYLPH